MTAAKCKTKPVKNKQDGLSITIPPSVVDFLGQVLFAIVFAGIAWMIGKTPVGERFSFFTYGILQAQLLPPEHLPLVVVDISELRPDEKGVTPRKELRMLLDALAQPNDDSRPAAIGVDIDFSPELDRNGDLHNFIDATDPCMFRKYANKRPPIFFGVYRTRTLSPDQWLGFKQFESLAASIWRPDDEQSAVLSLSTDDQDLSKRMKAPALSAALASQYPMEGDSGWKDNAFFSKLFMRYSGQDIASHLKLQKYLIDYSVVNQLATNPIKLTRSAYNDKRLMKDELDLRKNDIAHGLVLLGDVSDPQSDDVFVNPANRHIVPGVLMNGAAAITLAIQPLYVFRVWLRLLADLLLALAAISFKKVMMANFKHAGPTEERLELTIMVISVVTIFAFGVSINRTHVLWDDFIFVAIWTALHDHCYNFTKRTLALFQGWLLPEKGVSR